MHFPSTPHRDVEFDRTLSILHGWLGDDILLTVEPSSTSFPVAMMRGSLAAAPDIADTLDSARFGFRIDEAALSIHRSHFLGASYHPDAEHLEIFFGDRPGPSALTLNILRTTL